MRRRIVALSVLLAVAGAVLATVLVLSGDDASPTPEEVMRGIRPVASCAGEIRITATHNIGGPGLPEGMEEAHAIICRQPGVRDKRLVVTYFFDSSADAMRWLANNDQVLDDYRHFGWWLHGTTLTGGVNLTGSQWRKARALIARELAKS